jgi:hypothetical protein
VIVVLDTNVLISALLSAEGPPAQIIDLWEAGAFDVAVSAPLLDELKRVLRYKRVRKYLEMTSVEIDSLIKQWSSTAVYIDSEMRLDVVEDDPDDNRVLECAVAAEAEYIVSGDDHLLDLGEYRGIEVLPPAGFIVLLNL